MPKLSVLGRKLFIDRYIPDKLEWKMCAKMLKIMILSKPMLYSLRQKMRKCSLEDTSFNVTFHLVFNGEEGLSLMLPDQIAFTMFQFIRPVEVLLCGHFYCDTERMNSLINSVEGVTTLQIYKKSSVENGKRLLKRYGSQLKSLACDVGLLDYYLRTSIELEHYQAYYFSNMASYLSWIFKAVDARSLNLGKNAFTTFLEERINGPVRNKLESLIVAGEFAQIHRVFEFLSMIKEKAPNLKCLEIDFYFTYTDNDTKKYGVNDICDKLVELGERLKTVVEKVTLKSKLYLTSVEYDKKMRQISLITHPFDEKVILKMCLNTHIELKDLPFRVSILLVEGSESPEIETLLSKYR